MRACNKAVLTLNTNPLFFFLSQCFLLLLLIVGVADSRTGLRRRSAATTCRATARSCELMSGTAMQASDTPCAGSLAPRLVPSDIQPVHDCVPDEAGVSVTSIVVVVTPCLFLPVCQPWRRCLYLIHESVKVPGFNVDVCVQNINNLAAF